MDRRRLVIGLAALVLLAVTAMVAYLSAVGSPVVLEPGDRSTAHTDVDCLRCHDPYGGIQAALCEDCHTTAATAGWHTASGGGAGAECTDCHYEHVGRDRITDLTAVAACPRGDNITEAHDGLRCVECHRTGGATEDCRDCHERYIGGTHTVGYVRDCDACHVQSAWKTSYDHEVPDPSRPEACADCHGTDPPHALQAYTDWSDDCDVCHDVDFWVIPAFPHDEIKDPCEVCHAASLDPRWGGTSVNCSDCHSIDFWTPDVTDHERLVGTCTRCHSGEEPTVHLDQVELGFLDCDSCHGNVTWARDLDHELYNGSCVSCHVDDEDAHGEAFALDCQWCHGTEHWAVSLAHPAQDAGCNDCHEDVHEGGDPAAHVDRRHSALCAACHIGGTNWTVLLVDHDVLGSDCAACHAEPHAPVGAGTSACGMCHGVEQWVPLVVDHDLMGTDCASCHPTAHPNAWAQWSEQCTLCHVVDDWKTRSYDHDISNTTWVDCIVCHDDVHLGSYGRLCEDCHTVDTWETEVTTP